MQDELKENPASMTSPAVYSHLKITVRESRHARFHYRSSEYTHPRTMSKLF